MGAHEGCDGFWPAMTVRGNHRVGIGDVQLQLPAGLIGLAVACERFRHLYRLPEMRNRLLERRTAQSVLSRVAPPFDCQIFDAGRSEMTSDRLRFRLSRDERRGRASVQRLTTASQEAVVGRVLNQRMLEAVGRLWRDAIDEEKVCVHETSQGGFERGFVESL